jgi:hypothetical protein
MNVLRRLWCRLFPQPAPAPAPAPKPTPIRWDRALVPVGDGRREYVMPTPLPGVVPTVLPSGDGLKLAMDHGGETRRMAQDLGAPAAWGGLGSGALGPGLAFLGFPYLAELAQITEYRTPAESLSTEMTRRWLRLKSKGETNEKSNLSKAAQAKQPEPDDVDIDTDKDEARTEKIKQLDARLEELRVRDLFREAALKTEQFGRSHIYVSIKGQDDDITRQLPLTTIKQGTLLGLTCIEPYWLTPYSWNSLRPEQPDFYRPQSWFVLGKKTHHSRLMTFIFREVPDLLKPAYDFAGISMTQLMMPYVNRWLRTAKNVNDLINIFSVLTLATDLQALLSDPGKFKERLDAFVAQRDNRGLLAINKSTEELTVNEASLASLDKLQAQAQEHMATPGRMPLIKFFGITPTGLSTTSDGEFQAWYDYVHALQELGYTPHMKRVVDLVQMDLFGTVDDDITFEWLSLYEPTPKELADLRKSDADRDVALVNGGIVSADEVRDKLRRDPESGYDDLQGDAPDPPQIQEQQVGAELGEQGKQADHERGEESAEAAHGRAKELKQVPDSSGRDD